MNISNMMEHYYLRVTEIWKNFCQLHSELFNLTGQEYSYLLSNDIDLLENVLQEKEKIIELIKKQEKERQEIIQEINLKMSPQVSLNSIHHLLDFFHQYQNDIQSFHLQKYNFLLIDIIEKIQEQNRRNQIFVNKSLIILREIREGLAGNKNYRTYNSQGISSSPIYK